MTLTDGGPAAVLDLASSNAHANEALWAGRKTEVTVMGYTWGEVTPSALRSHDLILGSDLTYATESHAPLCRSLASLLGSHPTQARVVLAHERRVAVEGAVDDKLEQFMATANREGLRVLEFERTQHNGRAISLLEVQDVCHDACTGAADIGYAAQDGAATTTTTK